MNEELDSYKETKKFLEGRIAAGQIKRCPGCSHLIGEEYLRCGECISQENMAKDIRNTAK